MKPVSEMRRTLRRCEACGRTVAWLTIEDFVYHYALCKSYWQNPPWRTAT